MKDSIDSKYSDFVLTGPIELSAPTTSAQREIWASIDIDENANKCFNESISVELNGKVEVSKLKSALRLFTERHDVFRSCFTPDGRNFLIYQAPELNFHYYDLSLNANAQVELKAIKSSTTQISFDLINGPLYQFQLIKISELKYNLLITAHHLICDGWSMAVLVNEVSSLYEELERGSAILPKANQFFDFSLEFNKLNLNNELEYWKNNLQGAPTTLELPLDYERPAFRTYNSERIDYQLNPELVSRCQKLAAKNKLSFYHLLFSAYNVFNYHLTGQSDLVIGISSALQSKYGMYDLVGHLVQLLPIRTKVDKLQSFIQYAGNVKAKMLDANDHSNITFGDIVQNLNIKRSPDKIPLINVIFNVDQQYENQGFAFENIQASYDSNPRYFENFEIFVNATTLKDKCVLECQYNTNLFRKETIQKWLVEFENLLNYFETNATEPISTYKIKNDLLAKKINTKSINVPEEENITKVDQALMDRVHVLWKKTLKNESIDINSNFFQSGGHSLLAMDLVQAIKKDLGFKVSIKDIMLNPTVKRLTQVLTEKETLDTQNTIKYELENEFNLSFSQKQTWFLQELNPSTNMFNLPSSILVEGIVDTNKLKKAYEQILNNHPSLRSIFVKGPKQKILITEEIISKLNFNYCEVSLDEAKADMLELASKPIDIYSAPLFQFKLYKVEGNRTVIYNNFHHIVFDGWCFDIFFNELNLAYQDQELKKEARPYQEYIREQEQKITNTEFKNRVKELANFIQEQPLECLYPADFERPQTIDHRAGTLSFQFSADETQKLNRFVKETNTSLYNLFLTVFGLAILEKVNTKKLLIGTPLRARPESSDMNTIGYFVNSLPVLIEKQNDVMSTLKSVQLESLRTIEHEDIPLELLMQELKLKRDTSKTAIFQNFFSFQDVTNRSGLFNNTPYSQVNVDKATTHTDIDMWIKAGREKIEGALEYRLDLFTENTIKEFKVQFDKILLEVINSIESASVSKPKTIASNVLRGSKELDYSTPIFAYVEKYALETPNAIAFENTDLSLTYSELNTKANLYASYLSSSGLKAGDLVGLCCHRDENLIITLIALMKIGVGYVPLDPYFPDERLHYMLEHSGVKSLIAHSDLLARFESMKLNTHTFEDLKLYDGKTENPNIPFDANRTLYVIYTSGSTGKPKGVELGWQSVQNFIHSMQSNLGTNNKSKLLAVTTLSFDIAVLELYLPLVSGGTLVLADKFESIDGDALKDIIREKSVNIMQATPATWRLLLNAEFNPIERFTVLCGGEPFPYDLAEKLLKKEFIVWNMYGPTETTVWSTMKQLSLPLESITIGKPIHNTDIYILDDNAAPMAQGEVGELCIGGDGLAKGYFKRDDLSAKVFFTDESSGKRIYRTGDLAKINDDGEVVCLGRNDSQVKIRGYRIELGEIETRIAQFDPIDIVAVIVKEYSEVDKRLIAFYSTKSNISDNDIREYLQDKLPSYMVPNQFIKLHQFPLTLNGKIDKKSLADDIKYSNKEEKVLNVPKITNLDNGSNAKYLKLKNIWCELLQIEDFDDGDDFFDLGGHSLLAVELFSRIEKEFKLDIQLAALINNSSFKEVLSLVDPLSTNPIIKGSKKLLIPSLCECLVPIEINDSSQIIFSFHGVGGNILNYRVFKGFLKDYSLIGVQSLGVLNDREYPESLEHMAKRYIEEMKLVQPQGPYILAGGSMGGMIALEVAQQLIAAGEEVKSIIMFDTFGPNIQFRDQVSFIKRVKNSLNWRAKKYYVNTFSFFMRLLGIKIPHHYRHFNVETHNYKLLWKYRPKEYSGRVDLIRAPEIENSSYADPSLGWKGLLKGEFNRYIINGSHSNFVEVEELPSVFEDIISKLNS